MNNKASLILSIFVVSGCSSGIPTINDNSYLIDEFYKNLSSTLEDDDLINNSKNNSLLIVFNSKNESKSYFGKSLDDIINQHFNQPALFEPSSNIAYYQDIDRRIPPSIIVLDELLNQYLASKKLNELQDEFIELKEAVFQTMKLSSFNSLALTELEKNIDKVANNLSVTRQALQHMSSEHKDTNQVTVKMLANIQKDMKSIKSALDKLK